MGSGLDIEKLAEERVGVKEAEIKVKPKKPSFNLKKAKKKEPVLKKPRDGRFVSIDIGASFIKIVEGKHKNNQVFVTNASKIESSLEYVQNGALFSIHNIVNLIKNNIKEKNISTKDLVFAMAGSQIISREISVIYNKEISAKEFRMLIVNELEQYLPINLEAYDIQYREIEKFEQNGQPRVKVLVVACPKAIVRDFLKLAEDIGEKKKPFALDITNNAITKVYKNISSINGTKVDKKEIAMFIDLGANTFNVSILNAGVLEFMRTIQGGGTQIDNEIAIKIGMHVKEAEDLKIEKCDLMSKTAEDYNLCTKAVVADWLDELERISNFYSNKNNKRISKIYLYGGTAKLKGLTEAINRRLGIETVKINSVDSVDFGKSVVISNVDQYLNAIGTLIRL
ncbi:MAG: type IV pilus assembly protein PilM [Sarcina sp.]